MTIPDHPQLTECLVPNCEKAFLPNCERGFPHGIKQVPIAEEKKERMSIKYLSVFALFCLSFHRFHMFLYSLYRDSRDTCLTDFTRLRLFFGGSWVFFFASTS